MEEAIEAETRQLLDALKNIVETIDDAILKNAEQAAFFCSLSIPDIAGQIEYPSLRGEKNGVVGKRYKKWYDQNLYPYENPNTSDVLKLNKIDGEIMYLIRCKLYHQGDYSHEDVIERLSKRYGENVDLNFRYSSTDSKISILSDGDDRIKSVEIILNRKIMARKLKCTAKGVLREHEYL